MVSQISTVQTNLKSANTSIPAMACTVTQITTEEAKSSDEDFVVLRNKNNNLPSNIHNDINFVANEIPDEFENSQTSDENDVTKTFDCIQEYLDSDFIPDEFWQMQRESFIHRSYNQKLLARKNANYCSKRPESELPQTQPFKRDSFLRQSLNSIRKSFNKSVKRKQSANNIEKSNNEEDSDSNCNSNNNNVEKINVSIDAVEKNAETKTSVEKCFNRNSSSSSGSSIRSTNSVTLGFRSAPTTPMAPLQGQTDGHVPNVVSLNTLSRSPSHSSTKIDSRSAKQLSTSAPVATPNPRSLSPHPTKSSKNDIPEKEKKRKELSSGRQKKFHRHFQQVAMDERVINYFSCALVSDILLQGHLYITDNYFAFYSNVFGFVTKLLIPTVSVVKISKEKTAKIIPNAVGVATADERHVFGSFMSREAAYRLMLSVWRPVAPVEPEITPKLPDVEISECSIEDDSSSAISGNESPPRVQESTTSDASHSLRHRSAPCLVDGDVLAVNDVKDIPVSKLLESIASTNQSRSLSPQPKLIPTGRFSQIKLPINIHIVYVGVMLAVILALLSGFLLFRIMDIRAKANKYDNPLDFKWDASNKDIDVYAEVLKWQKEMQSKSVDEAQIMLNSNLEQIARVRKSLETLSILIHDKNAPSLADRASENYVPDKDSPLDVTSFGGRKT